MDKRITLAIILLFLTFYHLTANSVIRSAPEGKPFVELGDKAPLLTDELIKAHEEKKIILLMFGNPDHCRY